MALHVMMISRDPELVTGLATSLEEPDRLTVVDSPDAVTDHGTEVDAVVVDLPADGRQAACERVRERYQGRLVVPVDDGGEVAGWSPDPARLVLVRPFPVADLLACLEPGGVSSDEQAVAARRQVRRRPQGLIRPAGAEALDPAFGAPPGPLGGVAAGPADGVASPDGAAAAPPAGPAPRRLSPDEPIWDPPAVFAPRGALARVGTPGTVVERRQDPAGPPAGAGRRSGRRIALMVVGAIGLLLTGALAGAGLAQAARAPGGRSASRAATAAATAPPATAAPGQASPPRACADAMDDADAAISYLVAKIRDQRLSDALKRYGEHARACRRAVP